MNSFLPIFKDKQNNEWIIDRWGYCL